MAASVNDTLNEKKNTYIYKGILIQSLLLHFLKKSNKNLKRGFHFQHLSVIQRVYIVVLVKTINNLQVF